MNRDTTRVYHLLTHCIVLNTIYVMFYRLRDSGLNNLHPVVVQVQSPFVSSVENSRLGRHVRS